MVAFHEAIREFRKEGGIDARAARYAENNRIVREVRQIGVFLSRTIPCVPACGFLALAALEDLDC